MKKVSFGAAFFGGAGNVIYYSASRFEFMFNSLVLGHKFFILFQALLGSGLSQ